MSKPIKTSISRIDHRKISSIEEAIKVRDSIPLKQQRASEVIHKESFDILWNKYIFYCENVEKLAYNTILRRKKTYKKYLFNQIDIPLVKTDKIFWTEFIEGIDTTLKQKNEIIRLLNTFFNWCVREELLNKNPIANLRYYKVERAEMKYWIPDELKTFLETINSSIKNGCQKEVELAYRVKIFTLIGFNLGDRVGETRALTFNSFDKVKEVVKISHSINYNTKSNDFLGNTKTYYSQRVIDVSDKLIIEIEKYKDFLIKCGYNVTDDSIIFFNYVTDKPFSDTTLRKQFYKFCDLAKIKRIRMYDLRHTYVATMMMEGKELYHISKRVGHSSYSTTVNKYGHLSNQVRKEIAHSTDKYF